MLWVGHLALSDNNNFWCARSGGGKECTLKFSDTLQ